MADQRIKGQEVSVLITKGSVPLKEVADFRSLEFTYQMEVKSEGYLGETSNRKDDVFNGIAGKLELHHENQDVLKLIVAIVDRARRRIPDEQIVIKATLQYPNGQRPKVTISPCYFGPIPVGFGSRTDYGTVSLDFEAEQAVAVFS